MKNPNPMNPMRPILPGSGKPPRREADVQTILSLDPKKKPQQVRDHEERTR